MNSSGTLQGLLLRWCKWYKLIARISKNTRKPGGGDSQENLGKWQLANGICGKTIQHPFHVHFLIPPFLNKPIYFAPFYKGEGIRGNSSNKPPLRVDLLLNEGGVYWVWDQIWPKISPPAVRFPIGKSTFRWLKVPKFSACGGLSLPKQKYFGRRRRKF